MLLVRDLSSSNTTYCQNYGTSCHSSTVAGNRMQLLCSSLVPQCQSFSTNQVSRFHYLCRYLSDLVHFFFFPEVSCCRRQRLSRPRARNPAPTVQVLPAAAQQVRERPVPGSPELLLPDQDGLHRLLVLASGGPEAPDADAPPRKLVLIKKNKLIL